VDSEFITLVSAGLSPSALIAVLLLTFCAAAIHNSVGVGGGFLVAILLAYLIGVKAVLPVLSVSLLISNVFRAMINFSDFDRDVYLAIVIPAIPFIAIGSFVYSYLPATGLAIFLGVVIMISIPIRRWAKAREIKATRKMLHGAGTLYGSFAGASIGPGPLLIPFILGYGLSPRAFVATMAAIALTTNVTRIAVFGSTPLLNESLIWFGVLMGLTTIPGSLLGRAILKRLSIARHALLVDILTIFAGLNFFWIAFRS